MIANVALCRPQSSEDIQKVSGVTHSVASCKHSSHSSCVVLQWEIKILHTANAE